MQSPNSRYILLIRSRGRNVRSTNSLLTRIFKIYLFDSTRNDRQIKMNIVSNMIILFQSWTAWLVIIAISCVIVAEWKRFKYSHSLAAFQSFPRLPIVGSLYLVAGSFQTRLRKAITLSKTRGKPTLFWWAYCPLIVLNKTEDILKSITKNQDRELNGFFDRLLGDGIVLAKGANWRRIRRILNQGFTPPMLKQYMPVFNKYLNIMAEHLSDKANTGDVIDLTQLLMLMNFNIVIETMLGNKVKLRDSIKNEFIDVGVELFILESRRCTDPILFFNFFYKVYSYLTGYSKLYKTFEEVLKKVVKEKLRLFEESKKNRCPVEENQEKNIIDILLKVHDKQPDFDERRIRTEVTDMILAGLETTVTTMGFVCLLLAMHPEIQDKVYQEIQEVFNDDFTEVLIEHCNQLKYMEQCINESLRLFPVVPLTLRKCPRPTKLNDQQIIPANQKVAFIFHNVHHNPSVYPDPEKYDPDHFSEENFFRNANHFMGFGVGHRSCIATKYAKLSMKSQLVHLLRKYRFTTDTQISDIVYINHLIARSLHGYQVKIWHRQNDL